jgi:hypothetical protein
MPPVQKVAFRRVKCNDPRIWKKFNQHYKSFASSCALGTKIFQTEADSSYPPTVHALEQAGIIADLRYKAISYADKKCRQVFMGGVLFSEEYKTLELRVGFWNHMVAKKQGRKVGSKLLARFLIKPKDPIPLQDYSALTQAAVEAKAKAIHIKYRKFKKGKVNYVTINMAGAACRCPGNARAGTYGQTLQGPTTQGPSPTLKSNTPRLRNSKSFGLLRTSAGSTAISNMPSGKTL